MWNSLGDYERCEPLAHTIIWLLGHSLNECQIIKAKRDGVPAQDGIYTIITILSPATPTLAAGGTLV